MADDRRVPPLGANRPDPMAYGQAMKSGFGLNILVTDVQETARFLVEVFDAQILYWEEHFAVMQAVGDRWLLHSDWSYRNHPLSGAVKGIEARGIGAQVRLYMESAIFRELDRKTPRAAGGGR